MRQIIEDYNFLYFLKIIKIYGIIKKKDIFKININ